MNEKLKHIELAMIPCLSDNYAFLIHDDDNNLTAAIDTPDVPAIENALRENQWQLTHIFNTHHHWDHAGGNLELKEKTGCTIIGPRDEAERIPGIDLRVGEGDEFRFGNNLVIVHHTPGHTSGHIIYYFPDEEIVFVGDTLFSLGCGRLFEGTPEQMWDSLQKISRLPATTRIYCAHEYTQSNARFALSVDPGNDALKQRAEEIDNLRARGQATVPSNIALERITNPFLRPDNENIRKNLDMLKDDDVRVFAKIRKLKDRF